MKGSLLTPITPLTGAFCTPINIFVYVNQTLRAWVMRKFKRFSGHRTRAGQFLERIARNNPGLFVHWRDGLSVPFA
jgi:hypothetical protein